MPTISTRNHKAALQMIEDLKAKGIHSGITVGGLFLQDIDDTQKEDAKKIAAGHGAIYSNCHVALPKCVMNEMKNNHRH